MRLGISFVEQLRSFKMVLWPWNANESYVQTSRLQFTFCFWELILSSILRNIDECNRVISSLRNVRYNSWLERLNTTDWHDCAKKPYKTLYSSIHLRTIINSLSIWSCDMRQRKCSYHKIKSIKHWNCARKVCRNCKSNRSIILKLLFVVWINWLKLSNNWP